MITIEFDKAQYMAGETVTATIRAMFSKPVKARALEARLVCEERKIVKALVAMNQDDYMLEKELGIPKSTNIKTETFEESSIVFTQSAKIGGAAEYSGGEFKAAFKLPDNAQPTSREFGHDGKIHVWKLHVKLDIPFGFDKNASKEVVVAGLEGSHGATTPD
ncbi:MAG TPA: hypothetical protein PLO51_01285 [Candidatus Micrarchaeota archaeon]|nr:hypothetical protein [Candidatus Micrarchaeota archaeon]